MKAMYAVSPPLPFPVIQSACDQLSDQEWEVVSMMFVGIQSPPLLSAQNQGVPVYCILARFYYEDIPGSDKPPYPKLNFS